jgi:hypothetical protein
MVKIMKKVQLALFFCLIVNFSFGQTETSGYLYTSDHWGKDWIQAGDDPIKEMAAVLITSNWVKVMLGDIHIKYKLIKLEQYSDVMVNVYVSLNGVADTMSIAVIPFQDGFSLGIDGVFFIENAERKWVEAVE